MEDNMQKEYWKPGNMLYPLPVVMVSCQRPGERPNIITVAWAGTICSDPAMLSVSVRPERYSHGILGETGQFVVNLVNRDLVYATDYCGVRSGRDVDKFGEMHLTPLPSRMIAAPGIAESPVNLECQITQTIPLGSHDLFLARILGVTVDGVHGPQGQIQSEPHRTGYLFPRGIFPAGREAGELRIFRKEEAGHWNGVGP